MDNTKKINLLIVHHALQQTQVEELERHIHGLAAGQYGLDIAVHNLSSAKDVPPTSGLHALIILFSASLEKNENLYQLIRQIESRSDLERFLLFMDHNAGQAIAIPPIFHAIRAQQHHIYPASDQLQEPAEWQRMQSDLLQDLSAVLPALAEPPEKEEDQSTAGFIQRIRRMWRSPRTRMTAFSLLLLVGLGWLLSFLAPEFFSSLQPRQIIMGAASQPPLMQDFWLQENFSGADFPAGWVESNRLKGQQALSITRTAFFSREDPGLKAEAVAQTDHAIYRLQSEAAWQLNEMQAVTVGYQTASLVDESGQAGLDLQITLADHDDYLFGCRVEPSLVQAALACYIREPGQQSVVEYPQDVSLDEWHTLTIQFVPRSYSLRFYLDDRYFGQSAIPSPEFWRDRDFHASLQVELQDLNSGSFSALFDDFRLSRQPLAGEE